MTPVQSSNIASIGHDPINLTLTVGFRSGSVYKYSNVPTDLFDQLIKADSVGSAFHRLIKSQPEKYGATKVL